MNTTVQRIYAGFYQPAIEDELTLIRRFLIADVYARFFESRGDSVVFGIGAEVGERGIDDVDHMRLRLEGLGLSCDWSRTVVSSDPEHLLLTQTMFLLLLERNLIYRRNQQNGSEASALRWIARTNRFAEQCNLDLTEPPGWNAGAMATQRAALGAIDGVEIRAVIPGLGDLLVFTPHPDSLAQAAFVSVSPNHPEVGTFTPDVDQAQLVNGGAAATETSLQVAVPGVDELLPLVVAPSVDARFGPTAVLGIPSEDEVDRQIAKQLKPAPGIPLGSMRINSKPSASRRSRLPDLAVTHDKPWGAPVPMVHCPQCGPVPVPAADLPLQDDAAIDRDCPQCGGPASRDPGRIDEQFSSLWMWPSICGGKEWESASLVVWDDTNSEQLLWQRVAGYMLQEDEPFARVLVHGSLDGGPPGDAIEIVDDLDERVARSGPDAVRFAILNAGSPGRSTHLYEHLVKHAERFISEAIALAERVKSRNRPAPKQIDLSTRSRRRLAAWSRTATEKVAAHLDQMEIHKATYDLILFQRRILEFESRHLENGGLDDADWDALALALVDLGRLAEPFVPELAAKLQELSQD
ncbi:MAG TPA: hypothetical protein VF081_08890 [Solirubrobacterales bacterium]